MKINPIHIEGLQRYPGIDFLKYYLWRDDPILRWNPSVRQTSKYFKENPSPEKVSFEEKYDLYGDLPQAKMPVRSVEGHYADLDKMKKDFKMMEALPPSKTNDGITEIGLKMLIKAGIIENTKHKPYIINNGNFIFNDWQGMSDIENPVIPVLNIGGHKILLDTNNGTLLSKDIWKFNPNDFGKWNELGGNPAQSGLLDKLGKPFITVNKTFLSPEARQYLENYLLNHNKQ